MARGYAMYSTLEKVGMYSVQMFACPPKIYDETSGPKSGGIGLNVKTFSKEV